MEIDDCGASTRHRLIKVSENGKTFAIANPEEIEVIKLDLDKCKALAVVQRCDYIFYIFSFPLGLYVELKGKDLDKACKQLAATLTLMQAQERIWERELRAKFKRECYIVCSRVTPNFAARKQNVEKKFLRETGVFLYVRSVYAERDLTKAKPS